MKLEVEVFDQKIHEATLLVQQSGNKTETHFQTDLRKLPSKKYHL